MFTQSNEWIIIVTVTVAWIVLLVALGGYVELMLRK